MSDKGLISKYMLKLTDNNNNTTNLIKKKIGREAKCVFQRRRGGLLKSHVHIYTERCAERCSTSLIIWAMQNQNHEEIYHLTPVRIYIIKKK